MMRHVNLDFAGLFDGNRSQSEDCLLWLMEMIAWHNLKFLEAHPETPRLYESHVRYALPDQIAECRIDHRRLGDIAKMLRKYGASDDTATSVINFLSGVEVFRDIPRILEKGRVDCDNLACYRLAELWRASIKARAYMTSRPNGDGGTTYHALVLLPDGSSEDPSLILGMGGEDRASERKEEIRKNVERHEDMARAAALMVEQGADPQEMARRVDLAAFVPRDGVFRC
jgi:hypothetical protein